ncbi:alpha-amylase family glycosyl hydrolase [Gordonia sp. p3-SID1431]|uniref:alpha-amylase family glycosyl hydrolase n=1 Tax=Gordonia sp. p3-SID1431 TaxID=2916159 RepID=UPI0021A6D4B3|nr:alpha-amylase family glycosyl hydrolase [Gordonia sp. p3-SID1431]MCT1352243.1 alpha-amylase family glycosyl hydrolase [Gordonia sp. p3-SID1431]
MVDGRASGDRWRTSVPHPFIYEINVWPWLHDLSAQAGRPVGLGSVPDEQWDVIAALGFDAVWLMGVWERSPAGIAIALGNDELMSEFQTALPDVEAADVVGSPYCIRDYRVDPALGGPEELAAARSALAQRGMRLILDFVPNHVAPDHHWVHSHPEAFVPGSRADLHAHPEAFVDVGGQSLANGRDPYFPAWPDVVQLNAFSPVLRDLVIDTLRDIAGQCDGVRCDMAMLVMNDIFVRTWGSRVGEVPGEDYWTTILPAVRRTHPDFTVIAEAYWGLENALAQQGFDFCYDKVLYDRLVEGDAAAVRDHLRADPTEQCSLVRFVENHDEPRAAAVFERDREKAVVVTALTQAGARLVHEGQPAGRTTRLPVFLGRRPAEPTDTDLVEFHCSLLKALRDDTFRVGTQELCETTGWEGNTTHEQLVAWCWDGPQRWLVVVNLGVGRAAGHVRVNWPDVAGRAFRLVDPVNEIHYDRAGDDLVGGLYVELGPWQWHLFRIEPLGVEPGEEI